MQSRPPSYEARWWWRLVRPQLQIEVPLASRGWHTHGGRGLRIVRVERAPASITTVLVETRPVVIRTFLREAVGGVSLFYAFYRELHRGLLAIDHERREVGFLDEHNKPRIVIVYRVEIKWSALTLRPPKVVRDGKWVDHQPGWLDATALAVLTFQEEAVFSREMKIERFEMTPAK